MEAPAELVSFCREQQPSLLGMLTLYCGDRDVAEELTQEALARACLAWPRVSRLDSPAAWTYRVGFNLANSYFRRKRAEREARKRLEQRAEHDYQDPDIGVSLAVREATKRLPKRQRAVLVLRHYTDLSVRQVADLLQMPEGTVKTLDRKALANLRQDPQLSDVKGALNVV